ncbi:hypothetical protein [Chondrinema litorale]|uniref:hypothetical protein n=1 Tax=Chondrinema litorale TaxID=2994555 RepID=UPI002543D6A6|nr:hypothetical protein [Chondrinema litorale]UZR92484.1 hypothetical protein OQ292_11495 [Chondrinema litorale]
MKKSQLYIFNILLLLGALQSSCTRKVCPAYLSSFQPQRGAPNEFFAYFKPEGEGESGDESSEDVYADDSFLAPSFDEDTLALAKEDTFKNSYGLLVFANGEEPVESKLMQSTVRNKNGIVKKSNFFTKIFSSQKKRRNANYPKVVSTKNPRPFKVEDVEDDSTHQLVQKKEPPKNADQWYYEMEFGSPDSTNAQTDSMAVENQNAGDSLASENVEEDLEENGKKGKKKKRKKKKKEKKKKKKKGEAVEAEDEEDSFTEYVGSESLKEKKKKKKKKNDDKEEPDESTLDDT